MEITDYPNYLIYNDGRVYSKKRDIFLKPLTDKDGYYLVNLYKNKKPKTFRIHRLVGLHYLESVDGKDQIDHIDRDKTNNHISNLRWCNHSENGFNKGIQSNNKLGHKYISLTRNNTYEFKIRDKRCKISRKFKTLDECIKYRDDYISTHYPQRHLH